MSRVQVVFHSRIDRWSGYSNRLYTTLAALDALGHEVTLVVVDGSGEGPAWSDLDVTVHRVTPQHRRRGAARIRRLVGPFPSHVDRHDLRRERRALCGTLPAGGIAWCVEEAAVLLAPALRPRAVVYDLNDWAIPRRRSQLDGTGRAGTPAVRLGHHRRDIERHERLVHRLVEASDLSVVSTAEDRDALAVGDIQVLPNVVRGPVPRRVPPRGSPPRPTVLIVGQLRYWPNEDGVLWFAREVWPLVLERLPDARLRIAGDAPPSVRVLGDGPGIEVLGYVEDLDATWQETTVLAAPLRVGSGSRVKILDAWNRSVPVACTTVAAHGLRARPGCDVLIGDGPDELAAAVVAAHASDTAGRLVAGGRCRIETDHSFSSFVETVDRLLHRVTARS